MPQTYKNHTKFVPMFHYVTLPLLLINVIWSVYRGMQAFSFESLNAVGIAFALVMIAVFSRVNALKAQDRVIRLEERMRMNKVLPDDLKTRINDMTTAQLVALRFAPDEELSSLVQQALDTNATPKALKQAIENWRPDYQRV